MLTTREVIKTFYNALLQRLKKHRGDWNQNDPSADDYIKNRPFYTDENDKTVNVPEQKITIPSRRPYAVQLILPKLIEFVVGQAYEVKWDDETYSCVAFDMHGIGAIGNQGVFGDGTDTGEPFIMRISKAIGFGEVAAPEAIGTHTVEVTTTKVVTLDRKYLPDLGLAPVATSGSYDDLEDAPEIYYDIVRYDTSQSLAEDQKAQARDNIGAGTSNFNGSYNDLTDIIVGETYTYQSVTINNIRISTDTTIPENVKFEQITYQTTWKVKWSSSTSTFSLELNTIRRYSNYYEYSNSSNNLYSLRVYDNGSIRCTAPANVNYVNVTFDHIAVSTVIQLNEKYIPDTIQRVADMPILSSVATSGSYNDLTNKPTIPVQVQSDWSVYDDTSKSHILNRPCYDDVSYNSTSISIKKIADKCTNYNSTLGLYIGTVQTYADYKDILTLNRSNEIYALKFPNVNDPYIHFKYQKFWIALDGISGGTGTGTITIWGNPFLIYQSVQQYSTVLNKNLYLTVEDAEQRKNPLTQDMLNTGEPFAFAQDSLSGTYLGISGGLRVCSKKRFSSDIVYQYIRDLKQLDEKFIPEMTNIILKSSTADSTKRFKITIDDSGALTTEAVTE